MKKPETKIIKGKHKLTDDEKLKNADALAFAMEEKERLAKKKKDQSAEVDDEIKKQESEITSCLDKIRTGMEDRDFQCKVERDEEQKIKKYIHIDSGELITTAPFVAADYQLELAETKDDKSNGVTSTTDAD